MDNDPDLAAKPAAIGTAGPVRHEHSIRRINHLLRALGGERYLEIGVQRGVTWRGIVAKTKVAVDPYFRFEWENGPGETYFEETSDAFFTTHARGLFDVIFLDGLHTFEQTFRDFCASMRHSHPGTVWIIDDTVPSDVYSAIPSQQDARQQRRLAGGRGAAWHGDVYKVVFAIADFFPNLSFATIENEGNPQTLVWSEPRQGFRPSLDSLEAISRMDYFELQQKQHLQRRMPEASALQLAVIGAKAAMAATTT